MQKPTTIACGVLFLLVFQACNNTQPAEGEWIKGPQTAQLTTIENQFRGLDVAMVEIDYRYQELYWAGHDQNWDYATYQADKIKLALGNGLQRRPKRAQSAEHFIAQTLPEIQQAIALQDTVLFGTAFLTLTDNCNACHAMEKVPFFTVKPPAMRQSSIRN